MIPLLTKEEIEALLKGEGLTGIPIAEFEEALLTALDALRRAERLESEWVDLNKFMLHWQERAEKAEARIAELTAALEPFASIEIHSRATGSGNSYWIEYYSPYCLLKQEHVDRARAALQQKPEEPQ